MLNTIKVLLSFVVVVISFILLSCKDKRNTSKLKTSIGHTLKPKKILFVVTSHDKKIDTGKKTGYYLGEVFHPWEVLHAVGYEIDFVSPKGGKAPVDAFDTKFLSEFHSNRRV